MTRFIAPSESRSFFRLRAQWEPTTGSALGSGGGQVLGYDVAFDAELQRIGQISPLTFSHATVSPTNICKPLAGIPPPRLTGTALTPIPAVNNEGLSRTNKG
jgi:hypothetical protein